MNNIKEIRAVDSLERFHFIPEWAKKKRMKQADIVRSTGADKGVVSRWFNEGVVPKDEYLVKLAVIFGTDISGLFRHPDEERIAQLLRGRSAAERQKAIEMLELLFKDNDPAGVQNLNQRAVSR
ncbi:helix-turn-helix transcriptional regulator [Sinorhizobium sp. 8-89]|uniref:helix-turn-helix domain-containing protein n=1 Tax=Sinorhizobium sp. 7-81 TaxID=3049087 RepID=UPI0024C3E386|nr:helix-turn-helix transcriptional regulator [Sinorhizobium sp. 7-81]MDK1386342.1 helix-turn-helix transcriptional regulator [Sinorhizobium sp. 7-81]